MVVLAAVDRRAWASPLRAVLVAAGASVPVTLLVLVLSGFSASPVALVLCVALSALPAGLAVLALDHRGPRRPTW